MHYTSAVPRLSEDDSGEDDSGEDELSPTVLCGYVDSENLVQCLNICVSDVDNPKDMTAVIEICVSFSFRLFCLSCSCMVWAAPKSSLCCLNFSCG